MPTRFTLRQVEYFVAVGEAGSILRASERIHVSSPSISTAISQLEAEFGLRLFVRKHAHGLSLTRDGWRMLERARALLAEAERLDAMAGDIARTARGPLSVGCLLTFAQIVLPELRRSFEATHPDVRVTQHVLDHHAILDGLRRAEIDVALYYELDIPDDLRFAPLAVLRPYALLPADHALAGRPAVSIADLAGHPMVLLDLPHSGAYFLSLFADEGLRPQVAERVRDLSVMRALVANGFGYGLANLWPLDETSPDGKPLRHVPLAGDPRPITMGLVTAGGAGASATIRAFAEHCADAVAPGRVPGMNPRRPDGARPDGARP